MKKSKGKGGLTVVRGGCSGSFFHDVSRAYCLRFILSKNCGFRVVMKRKINANKS